MKTFISTYSKFHTNPENEELGTETWEKYSFDIEQILGFNESTDGWTTIELLNGNRWIIAIKHDEFKTLMSTKYNIVNMIDAKAEYEYKEQDA